MVKLILRIEELVFFLFSLYFYFSLQGNWLLFILLLFVPDISMIGYLKNKKIGSLLYNLMHNYVIALFIVCLGYLLLKDNLITSLGIILFAHVSLDRFLGYGLKYATAFNHTHIQKM